MNAPHTFAAVTHTHIEGFAHIGPPPQQGRTRSIVSVEPIEGRPHTVDAADDIAEFPTTRRAKITPGQAGLP
jgi:hypothetical protein